MGRGLPAQAQKIVRTSSNIAQISTDGKRLFSISTQGTVSLLDTTAAVLATFDPLAHTTQITLLLANPLKPICYLPGYAAAIILDKALNPQLDLNIQLLGIHPQALVSITSGNILWAYDPADNTLVQYDLTQNKRIGTPNALNIPNLEAPFQLYATPRTIYLVDVQTVHVFDFSGNYQYAIPLQTTAPIQFATDRLWYAKGKEIIEYHFSQKTNQTLLTLPAEPSSFAYVGGYVVAVCNRKTYWYKMT